MNWLNEFLDSSSMRRIIVANYIDHVRQNNAFRGNPKYATIEEALQDFAQRTGLSEMQKRALRRDIMLKVAVDATQRREKRDLKQVELGEAPPSVLPGVKPGSQKEKLLRKKLQKTPAIAEVPDLPVDTGLVDRGTENSIDAEFKPGLIIEAAEESVFEGQVEEERPKMSLKETKRPGRPGTGQGHLTSKEQKLVAKIKHLESELIKLVKPGSTLTHPVWRGDAEFERGEVLKGELEELKMELAELTRTRRRKEDLMKPSAQAARNDAKFRVTVDDVVGIRKDRRPLQETFGKRKEAFKKLSDQGLQEVFDEAIKKFRKGIEYRPSQGRNEELGDYVKCMVCAAKKKLWVYHENPAILPFWHLLTHEEELLGAPEKEEAVGKGGVVEELAVWKGQTTFHNELVNAYLKKYTGAFLEAREQELGRTFESMVENSRGRSLLDPVHVATEQDKELDYSDEALLESILYQLRRCGAESMEKSREEMAQEVLETVKEELDQAFPGKLSKSADGALGPIGKLEDLGVPFLEFQKIFHSEVSDMANWYRGTLLRRRPPRKREKVRWTNVERQERRRQTGKQLEWERAYDELHKELGQPPTDKQVKERLQEKHMVPVGLSIYTRGCWNCGEVNTVYTTNSEESIDSVTCPNCGAYREKLVGGKGDQGEKTERWECPKCHEEKILVIRDPNITQPETARRYDIYCDERRINGGPLAQGYAKCIALVGQEETYTYTPVQTEEETGLVTEQMKTGDRVKDEEHGIGTVVWIEEIKDSPGATARSRIWVDFDSGAGEKLQLVDAIGHIIAVSGKYYKLVGVKVIPKEDEKVKPAGETPSEETVSKEKEDAREEKLMVTFQDQRKNKVVKFLGVGDLDKEYLFLYEVPGSQITRVSYFKDRILRRAQFLKRLANIECDHMEPFWVYRKSPHVEPAEAGKESIIKLKEQYKTHLQRRLARAALLKALMRKDGTRQGLRLAQQYTDDTLHYYNDYPNIPKNIKINLRIAELFVKSHSPADVFRAVMQPEILHDILYQAYRDFGEEPPKELLKRSGLVMSAINKRVDKWIEKYPEVAELGRQLDIFEKEPEEEFEEGDAKLSERFLSEELPLEQPEEFEFSWKAEEEASWGPIEQYKQCLSRGEYDKARELLKTLSPEAQELAAEEAQKIFAAIHKQRRLARAIALKAILRTE